MINSRDKTHNGLQSCQHSEEKSGRLSHSPGQFQQISAHQPNHIPSSKDQQNHKLKLKTAYTNQDQSSKEQNCTNAKYNKDKTNFLTEKVKLISRNENLKMTLSEEIRKPSFIKHNQKLFQEALDKLKRIEAKSLIQNKPDEIMKHVDDAYLFEMLQKSILQTQDTKSHENLMPLSSIFDQRSQSITPGQLPQRSSIITYSKHSESLLEEDQKKSASPTSNRKEELIKKITAAQKYNQITSMTIHQDSSKISSNSNRSFNKSTISSHNTSKNNKILAKCTERVNQNKVKEILKRNEGMDKRSKYLILKTERILSKANNADLSRGAIHLSKEKRKSKNRDIKSQLEGIDSENDAQSNDLQKRLIKQCQKILSIDDLFSEDGEKRRDHSSLQKQENRLFLSSENLITDITLEEHFKRMSPIKLRKINEQDDLSILSTDVAQVKLGTSLENPSEKDSTLKIISQFGRGSRSSREFLQSSNSRQQMSASDIQNMAYQMSQRQLQQQNIVQPGPFPERQPGHGLSSQNFFQSQQQKPKTSTSQTRGTQQPQQIQHKMSQKKLVEEIKQMNRKLDISPAAINGGVTTNFPSAVGNISLNPINSSNPNITQNDLSNLSQKLQNQISIPSIGRNSQQGIYSNLQMRSAPGIYNNIQSKTQYNNGAFPTNLNSSGYLGFSNDRSMLMSSSGYQQYTQSIGMNGPVNPLALMQQASSNQGASNINNTFAYINSKNAINMSSQSLERPTSQQSNAQQRKTHQSFLTPQRQAKLNDIQRAGKKLIIKPNQILKNQQSPSSQQYQIGRQNYPSQIGAADNLGNLSAKDRVLMDKRTYDELMNYLVKVECKRIEKDRIQSNHFLHDKAQIGNGGQMMSGKRPNSTLKRLAGQPGGERLSNNPRPYGIGAAGQYIQSKDAFLFNPTNNFNNSSFLSAAPTSLGRNSKLSKTPQKKLAQPSKLKNIMQIQNKQLSSAEERGIATSSSLRQIKRNNYVNELQSAYNHQTENLNKSANTAQPTHNQQQQQISSFFNINQSQSIPTSKKGTQKKIELQDTLPQEYQQMTQPKLQQLLNTGKFTQAKAGALNPQAIYMGDKVQSARGAFKGKDFMNISAMNNPTQFIDLALAGQNSEQITKSSVKAAQNLVLNKDKQIKQAPNATNSKILAQSRNQDGLSSAHANSELSSKHAMSQRDNSVGSKQISSRQQNQILSSQDNGHKLNKAQEISLVKRLTSAKVKKENANGVQERGRSAKPKEQNEIERRFTEGGDDDLSKIQIQQIDSDLLYGSNLEKDDNYHVIMKDNMPSNDEVYIIDHIDHQNFNTFGDSEKNKVITAVSELQSPDNKMHSPKNLVPQSSIKTSIPHRLENDPYKNQSFNGQEFHYSGSFGVPITLANSSYHVDPNNKIVKSIINQGPNNLSFSLIGQTDMSMISQDQLQANHQVYIDQKGAIIIEDNDISYEENQSSAAQSQPLSIEKQKKSPKQVQTENNHHQQKDLNFLDVLQDDEDEVQQIFDHPFYLQDYQEDYLENDQSSSPSHGFKEELIGIDNSTVEAVKRKLINDPEYRRELLERVLPQFSKLNEQFTNSFLYKLKYANDDSSQASNSVQKSNQSTQRYIPSNSTKKQADQLKMNAQSQQSLKQINQGQLKQMGNLSDNLIVQSTSDAEENGFELDDDLYTFDQRRGTDADKQSQALRSSALTEELKFKDYAAYELLRKINMNFNRANLNTIQSSQRRDEESKGGVKRGQIIPGTSQTSSMQNMGKIFIDSQNKLLLNSDRNNEDNDEDETNTVIENECENEYTDIYQSIGDDDDETEELRKKREFEYEKLLLKRQIMMVAGPIKNNEGSSQSKK